MNSILKRLVHSDLPLKLTALKLNDTLVTGYHLMTIIIKYVRRKIRYNFLFTV